MDTSSNTKHKTTRLHIKHKKRGGHMPKKSKISKAFLPDAASRRFRKTNAAIALTPPPSRDRTYFVVGLRRLKY